jgi:hypothetical protein
MKKAALVHFNHTEKDGLVGWADFRTSNWKPNYGDMLVCSALKRQIGVFDKYVRVGFGYELKEKVDIAVIRGSTYLHNKFDFEAAIKTLDSIDVPLAIVGLGAQNPTKDLTFLDNNKNAEIFIKKLAEKSKSISVRGEFSAEIVKRLGGENIRVTGCPSVFYTLKCPTVTLPELLASPQRRLGVSLHTGLMNDIFCRSPLEARELHGQLINFCIRNASSVSLYEQGVGLEFNIADKLLPYEQRVEAANEVIKRLNAKRYLTPEDLISRMVSVLTIEEWLSKARDQDALIGFRFHGNMVGLLQGSPCLYYVYDSRLEEFCEIYNLPWEDVTAEWKDPVKTMLDFDWSKTNAAIAKCYEEMKAFYAENGIAHVIGD